jgi:hypothetical protein
VGVVSKTMSKPLTIDVSAIDQKNLECNRALMVRWRDSTSTGRWRREMVGNPCGLCVSVGFFLYENRKALVLAMSLGDCGEVMDTLAIPKGCIEKVRRVLPASAKPKRKAKS